MLKRNGDPLRIGLAGYGFVGQALSAALKLKATAHDVYDPGKGYDDVMVLADCDLIFVQVGTPEVDDDLETRSVYSVVGTLNQIVKYGTIIAIKSTVPPGTNAQLASEYPNLRFVSVPEFLVQDDALRTFTNPDRIVIGARTHEDATTVADVLCEITEKGMLHFCTPTEAELIKLSSNVLLASKVAVANQLHDICESYGVEWDNVRLGIELDSRIGPSHLRVTEERGFGGACFPKDLRGMIAAAQRAGVRPSLLQTIEDYNRSIRRGACSNPDHEGMHELQDEALAERLERESEEVTVDQG